MWNTFILEPAINALIFIYDLLGENFGLAIIVFTALVRLITLPLTYQQMRSSMVMAEIQKSDRFKKMQEKYKNDKKKLSEEQMKFYREVGHNPFSGCLGLIIQFPIIIGLYQAVIRSLAATPAQLFDLSKFLYAAIPADLIPLNTKFLWMANLGQPERLPLPFLQGTSFEILHNQIPILTILVVISTYLQTKLTTPTSPDQQGAQMTQMMTLYMPLLLGYFAYTLASGLALYFVTSNLLGIVQGFIMRRTREANAGPEGALPKTKKAKQAEQLSIDAKKKR
jgi:YidC/Oxa1 family membrane protein insertase